MQQLFWCCKHHLQNKIGRSCARPGWKPSRSHPSVNHCDVCQIDALFNHSINCVCVCASFPVTAGQLRVYSICIGVCCVCVSLCSSVELCVVRALCSRQCQVVPGTVVMARCASVIRLIKVNRRGTGGAARSLQPARLWWLWTGLTDPLCSRKKRHSSSFFCHIIHNKICTALAKDKVLFFSPSISWPTHLERPL